MTFVSAVGIQYAIAAVGVIACILSFADQYHRPFGVIAGIMWTHSPSVFVSPLIATPISVLLYRWLWKEPREAKLAVAAK